MYQETQYDDKYNREHQYDFVDKQSRGLFLAKVFGMMFLCLAITTIVAAGLGYGMMYYLVNHMVDDGAGNMVYDPNIIGLMIGILIGSAIILIIMSFVLPIMFIRGKHNIIVPLMIYVVLMGAMLSCFTWMFEPIILIESFGITAAIFGLMALLGFVSKGNLSGIWVVLIGLLVGAGLLAGLNFLMILFGQISEANVALSWIVSLLIFAFLMLMTMWDVARINSIATRTDNQGKNLIYYCAYILYSDFIAILIRVIRYVAIFTRRR